MSSGPGWPDDMRRVLAHGDVLKTAAGVALPNPPAGTTYGPFPVAHATGVRVMVAPTGGNVTVTLTFEMDGVANPASGVTTLTFLAGTATSQVATCLGHLVSIKLVGSVNGVTADVWAVTANPFPPSTAPLPVPPTSILLPTFVNRADGSTNENNHFTTQLPTDAKDGDLLVMIAAIADTVGALTAPAGWNAEILATNSNGSVTLAFYWKAASSEPASYTWTHNLGSRACCYVTIAYRFVLPSLPIDGIGSNTSDGVTETANAVTHTIPFDGILFFAAIRAVVTNGFATTPTGGTLFWTERANTTNGGGNGIALGVWERKIYSVPGAVSIAVAGTLDTKGRLGMVGIPASTA